MTQIDRSDDERNALNNSRYMGLGYHPVTDEAKRFCKQLALEVTHADPKRRRSRRGKKLAEFVQTIGAIIADMLMGHGRDKSIYSSCSFSANAFTNKELSYRQFCSAMRGLIELQLIYVAAKGFLDRQIIPRGFRTRIGVTEKLLQRALSAGITPRNIPRHFRHSVPSAPLVLRAPKGKGKQIKNIKFEETDLARELSCEVHELNEFLSEFVIEGATHRGFRRVFNEGTSKGYTWDKGGRLISDGLDSYQRLKPIQRKDILIDGEGVVEIDLKASQLTILHGLMGRELDLRDDPYKIEGYPRDLVKQFVTMTLGNNGVFHKRWPSQIGKDYRDKHNVPDLQKTYPLGKLRSQILDKLPVLHDLGASGITTHKLMFLESMVIVNTMLTLKRAYGIPCLPVHDSIICKRSDLGVVDDVLRNTFFAVCKIKAITETK
jgi:hypothetical protein